MSFRVKKFDAISPNGAKSRRNKHSRRRRSPSKIVEYIPTDSIEILHRHIDGKSSKAVTYSVRSARSRQTIKTSAKSSRRNVRYTGGGDHPRINQDWDRVAGWHRWMSFNLEFWWNHSTTLERLAVAMAALCLAIFFANLVCGIWLICEGIVDLVQQENPYICKTQECTKASIWLTSKMDKTKKPCDNFYEYMCGKTSNDTFIEYKFYDYTWAAGFSFIPGEDSVLAKILNNPQNDLARDQTTRFYQTCLDPRNHDQHGMGAFFDKVEYIYGTRDFTTFETSSLSLEEVGSRMMRITGHISYLTFGFHVYPYIEIQTGSMYSFPVQMRFDKGLSDNKPWDNANFIRILAENILANLNVPANSPITKQVIAGVNAMSTLYSDFRTKLEAVNGIPKTLSAVLVHPEFNSIMKTEFIDKGACPPLSIRLNVPDILQRFLGEDYRLTFADLLAAKVYAAFKVCFEQPSPKFNTMPVTHPRSAFVGIWILHFFLESLPAMEKWDVLQEWDLTPDRFKHNKLIYNPAHRKSSSRTAIEFNCRVNLFQFFGYMPSIEYIESLQMENPAEFLKTLAKNIETTYSRTANEFNSIPRNEIHALEKKLAKNQFQRGVHVEVGLPLVSGTYSKSAIMDDLNITNDHLRNSLNGKIFVIEKARRNWIASTNTAPTVRWFGSGGRSNLVRQLFGIEEPLVFPARYIEKEGAGRGKGEWETFLGRKYPNYILYPLVLIGQPHYNDLLALWHATYKAKLILSILALNLYQGHHNYPRNISSKLFGTHKHHGSPRKCTVLANKYLDTYRHEENERIYKYTFLTTDLNEFSPLLNPNYNIIISLRQGLKFLRKNRESIDRAHVTWNMDPESKKARMERFLPKGASDFSEDKLFFMTFVRNYCIGSFKKSNKKDKMERWDLESVLLNVLMQTKEFSEVWGCKPKDFMSNNGYPRCLKQ